MAVLLLPNPQEWVTPRHSPTPPMSLEDLSAQRSILGFLLLSRGEKLSILQHSGVVFEGEQGKKYATFIGRIVDNVHAGLEGISDEESGTVSSCNFSHCVLGILD